MRKVQFFLLLLILCHLCIFSQNPSFSIGDNILQYFNANPPSFKVVGTRILDMDEGVVDYYKYKTETTEEDIKFLVIQDKYVIGVLQNNGDKDYFLFDMDGDGTLDSEYNIIVIPFWILSDTENKTEDDSITQYLDKAMNLFNSDENPYSSGKYYELTQEILRVAIDPNEENRDLFFALYNHYYFGNNNPQDSGAALRYLTNEYWTRFEADHGIFYLHTAENALNIGDSKHAKPLVETLLEIVPDFVPGKVYQWQLEKDEDLKKEYYEALKRDHPNHWIVIQI